MNRNYWINSTVTRPCPLCGASESKTVATKMQYDLDLTTVICSGCSFVYTNPLPSEEIYNQFYVEAYANYYGNIAVGLPQNEPPKEPSYIRKLLDLVEQYIDLNEAKLLEVGPGKGNFLYWAQARGAKVQGVEPSEEFHHYLSSNGIPTVNDVLENVTNYSFGKFDCIAMFHVLEHFYDPNLALQVCGQIISDNGFMVIIVPNILLPYRSLERYFLRYVHPSNFSPQTLQAILNKHGFTVVDSQLQGNERWYQPHSLLVIAQKNNEIAKTFEPPPPYLAEEVRKKLDQYRLYWRWVKAPRWHLHQIYLSVKKSTRRRLSPLKHLVLKATRNI